MMKTLFLYFLFLSIYPSIGQTFFSLQGKVMDAKTREPLPGASVYLAQTTIGIAAKSDGSFVLKNILSGSYDLIVSMVGYKRSSKTIIFESNLLTELPIYLEEENKLLNQVQVIVKHTLTNEYYKFEKIFLGETVNSKKCKVMNPFDIFVYRDGDKLIAKAKKPIEIINNAMGYKIFYELKDFVFNYNDTTAYILGTSRFENLVTESKKIESKWAKERDRAYYGSIEHFIRALKNRQLKKNNFRLYNSNGTAMSEEKLFNPFKENVIQYKGKLNLIFTGELAENSYDPQHRVQESILTFKGPNVKIYENGVYAGYRDIVLRGYLGWSSRISEIVPLGYEPISKLK